jgi:lysophospholipase L1-like esterase
MDAQAAFGAAKKYTDKKAGFKAIDINQTNFAKAGGKNIFNKDTAVAGYKFPGGTHGETQANADWYVSDYMPVSPSTDYVRTQPYTTVFYDSSLTFISYVATKTFTTPANCAYIRIDVYKTVLGSEQVELGTASTAYEAFNISIPKLYIPKDELVDYDAYPFIPTATLKTDTARKEIRKAVKRVELYGADASKKYALAIVQRNFTTYGTGMYIAECNADGSFNKYVACTYSTTYVIPEGLTAFTIAQANSSGVSAKVWIDWSYITDGAQYVTNKYQEGGLDARCFAILSDEEIKIVLPPSIPAVVGKEVNVYFDNVIIADNIDDFSLTVACNVGTHQNERWTCVPTVAGTNTLTLTAYRNGNPVVSASTSIIAKADTTGNGVTKSCIFIGDSTTDAGKYTQELLTLFGYDVMDITLLGTRGVAPNLHEGRAGWTAQHYTDLATFDGIDNPFYNSGFDFSYYMTQQGYTGVDVVGIHLGINDLFSYTSDASFNTELANVLTRFDTMVNSIKTYNAATKVAILITIPPSKTEDAFGKNYGNGQTRWREKLNMVLFAEALIIKYKGREAESIYLVPINVNLDTIHNMAAETVAVNSRNNTQVVRQSNGVHPANSGYFQMSDVIYYWLKGQEV